MAQRRAPLTIDVPSYQDYPWGDLPTVGLHGDTDEAGNVLAADISGVLRTSVAPIANETKLVSLPNPGNLCFRNAVLHSLFNVDKFVQLLEAAGGVSDRPIYPQLRKLARLFREGDPSVTGSAVDQVWTTITNTDATDASPAYDEYASKGYKGISGQQDAPDDCNPIYRRLFAWDATIRAVYDCPCKLKLRQPLLAEDNSSSSIWTKSGYTFNVSITQGGSTNLADAITRSMVTQLDPTNNLRCPICQQGKLAVRFYKFFYLPDLLPITVDYVREVKDEQGKISTRTDFMNKVDIQERINLCNICERPSDQRNAMYKLKAMVSFQGGTTDSKGNRTGGHYIAYIRRGDDAWDLINDIAPNRVSRCQLDAARASRFQPRILFYEKETPQPDPPAGVSADGTSTGRQDGSAARHPQHVPPPAEASYEPYITFYTVQWKPSGNSPANGDANTVRRGCGCSANRNVSGPPGDRPPTEGDHPDEIGDNPDEGEGTSSMSLRGGDGSEKGDEGDEGNAQGRYPGYKGWTKADLPKFRGAFSSEFLRHLPSGSTVEEWRAVLDEHLSPTGPVDYDRYTLTGLRRMCNLRGLEVGGTRRQPYLSALRSADRAANSQDNAPDNVPDEVPGDNPDGANQVSANQVATNQNTVNQYAATQQDPVRQDPEMDAPDPSLEARLHQLENLIATLENDSLPCACPLNSQIPQGPTCQGNTNTNIPGTQAQPYNRGLHIRITPTNAPQAVGSRDYWVPLPPEHNNQGLRLRVSTQVGRHTPEGLYPVRFSFSGPQAPEGSQPPEGQPPVLPRDAPFRNTIRFNLPFYIRPEHVAYEIWQEDLPNVPLMDTRGIDVINESQRGRQEPADSSQQGMGSGRPRTTLLRRVNRRAQPDTPTPQGRGGTVTIIGDNAPKSSPSKGRTRTATEAGHDEGGSPSQKPKTK
ncbi:Ubiquitin carboxyl-terminal hydrolase 27 [Cytospora mali]|uniref:ubiquitinyl hydrolase 1 n=1 Tax=Cytospora mali TaxID=578113 RepID=A0A194UVI9_CYTMA|nr:Ubiquitin carboxyl-terminal hydrolase 27 [Valsa mali var. pyri (nom. inval.)]